MDSKILHEAGLTEGESRVYLALLKSGASKTGIISEKAGVSSSKIYSILARLEEKGLASHAIKGGTRHYRALGPRRLIDYLEERKAQIDEKKRIVEAMLPELEGQMKNQPSTEATIYKGFKAVTNFFRSLLDELKKDDSYCVIGAGYGDESISDSKATAMFRRFFHKYHQLRALKKIRLKMLANYNLKGKLEETTKAYSEIRYMPQGLITNMEIVFYRDKTFIVLFANEPMGFLIESGEVSRSFEAYFSAFWKSAIK